MIRDEITPGSFEAAARSLAEASAAGRPVRFCGGGSKLGWSAPSGPADLLVRTAGLDATLEHRPGDLTAVFAAGVPLARAQAELAAAGQTLALDPPLGANQAATIGGVFATADAGPLAHRYGTARDQILTVTVALSDGTIARAGAGVIRSVAGFDLPKLFTGSAGTLGMILAVGVRLRSLPDISATALGAAPNATVLTAAAARLAAAPLELEALDIGWRGGRGGLLARVAGAAAPRRAAKVAAMMRDAGLQQVDVTAQDEALWSAQRNLQRSTEATVVRVTTAPSQLGELLRLAERCGATLVGRAARGISYMQLAPAALPALRAGLPPASYAVVLDTPVALDNTQRFGAIGEAELAVNRAVKQRFDPPGVCNPGVFIGGI